MKSYYGGLIMITMLATTVSVENDPYCGMQDRGQCSNVQATFVSSDYNDISSGTCEFKHNLCRYKQKCIGSDTPLWEIINESAEMQGKEANDTSVSVLASPLIYISYNACLSFNSTIANPSQLEIALIKNNARCTLRRQTYVQKERNIVENVPIEGPAYFEILFRGRNGDNETQQDNASHVKLHSVLMDIGNCLDPDCSFQDWCEWESKNWMLNENESFAFLQGSMESGTLTTLLTRRTFASSDCLKFSYVALNAKLTVYLKYSDGTILAYWEMMSNITRWQKASFPIASTSAFWIVFSGVRNESLTPNRIRITNVTYIRNTACDFIPQDAYIERPFNDNIGEDSPDTSVIAGSAIASVVVSLLAVIVFVVWLQKRRKSKGNNRMCTEVGLTSNFRSQISYPGDNSSCQHNDSNRHYADKEGDRLAPPGCMSDTSAMKQDNDVTEMDADESVYDKIKEIEQTDEECVEDEDDYNRTDDNIATSKSESHAFPTNGDHGYNHLGNQKSSPQQSSTYNDLQNEIERNFDDRKDCTVGNELNHRSRQEVQRSTTDRETYNKTGHFSQPGSTHPTDRVTDRETYNKTGHFSQPGSTHPTDRETYNKTRHFSQPGSTHPTDREKYNKTRHFSHPGSTHPTYVTDRDTYNKTGHFSQPGSTHPTDHVTDSETYNKTGHFSQPGSTHPADHVTDSESYNKTEHFSQPGSTHPADHVTDSETYNKTGHFSQSGSTHPTDHVTDSETYNKTGHFSSTGSTNPTDRVSDQETNNKIGHFPQLGSTHQTDCVTDQETHNKIGHFPQLGSTHPTDCVTDQETHNKIGHFSQPGSTHPTDRVT